MAFITKLGRIKRAIDETVDDFKKSVSADLPFTVTVYIGTILRDHEEEVLQHDYPSAVFHFNAHLDCTGVVPSRDDVIITVNLNSLTDSTSMLYKG